MKLLFNMMHCCRLNSPTSVVVFIPKTSYYNTDRHHLTAEWVLLLLIPLTADNTDIPLSLKRSAFTWRGLFQRAIVKVLLH